MRGTRILRAVAIGAVAVGAATAKPASAAPPAAFCIGNGWETVGTTDQLVFRNVGDCISYTARGGVAIPLLQAEMHERCVLEPLDPPNTFCITILGFGLDPGSQVAIVETIEGESLNFQATVDADGRVLWETAGGCTPGILEIVITVSASGITASGIPVATSTQSFSIFCTRA